MRSVVRGRLFAGSVVVALAAGVLVALPSIGSARAGDYPIVASRADAPGDAANGGPDVSDVRVTIAANGSITFAATLANSNGLKGEESLQFFVNAAAGNNQVNIAVFSEGYLPPTISTWTGSGWQDDHYIESSWNGPTFSATTTLSDLRDALQSPVTPRIWVSVRSYATSASAASDSAPDGGLAMSVPTTLDAATAPAPTNPNPITTPATKAMPKPKCIVPRVKGKTLARAAIAIRANHCKLGVVVRAPKKFVAAGLIFKQWPAPGVRRYNGSGVTLWIAKRP